MHNVIELLGVAEEHLQEERPFDGPLIGCPRENPVEFQGHRRDAIYKRITPLSCVSRCALGRGYLFGAGFVPLTKGCRFGLKRTPPLQLWAIIGKHCPG